jgi:hypothetical protein
MGGDEGIHLLASFRQDVLRDLADMPFFVWRADEDATVDENMTLDVS